MRPINFDSIAENSEGGSNRLPAGNYICQIVAAEDMPQKGYVRLLLDIVHGEHKGHFAGNDKPSTRAVYLSYNNTANDGWLKGRLHVITDCNNGFDAEAAWNGGKPELFVGKFVGCQFNEEEFVGDDGETKVSTKAGMLFRVAEIDDVKPARRKTLSGEWVALGKPSASKAASIQTPSRDQIADSVYATQKMPWE